MTVADQISAARALVAETEGHYPGPYRMGGPTGAGWSITSGGSYIGAAMGKATTGLFLAAPDLRDTVAALADLADAQAQENAKLKSKLARYAIHEEYDCPGDTPEFCGWLCSICGEHVEENGSGHLSDCVISGHNPNGDPIPSPEPAP